MFDTDYKRAVADDQEHRKYGEKARQIRQLWRVASDPRYGTATRLAALGKLRQAIIERERAEWVAVLRGSP